ncbi:MAG: DUF3352 domain-containing protein [Thermoleophilaceae bacterium]|nr:DUF3352 domain-containing protein [Thermoleophilaceae bacterium]
MRPPVRLVALLACLLAVGGSVAAFAGCGGDESGGTLDSTLGYLPKDTPFALSVDTDVDGEQYQALNAVFKKFPFGDVIKEFVLKALAKETTGVDFEKDVVPLLGNPFVVGASDPQSFLSGGDAGFVAAIEVSDEDKLQDVLEKSGVTEKGEQAGATIYDDSGTQFAVDGATVVFAGDREQLNQALERHDGGDGLDEDTFKSGLDEIGDDGIAQGYLNLESLLSNSESARQALKVKWIDAVEAIGLNAKVAEDTITIDVRIKTDPDGLTDADLPIAPGADAPPIVDRPGEIGIGLRGLDQTVAFIETVAQAVAPSDYGDYSAAKRQLEARLDVDVEKDLLDQLSGDISASISLDGDFGVRVEPKDPDAFEKTLEKIAPALPTLAEALGLDDVALERPKGGEDLYALAAADGTSIVFGVKNGVFVITNDPGRADDLALDEPTAATGQQGAVVAKVDAERLATTLLEEFGGSLPIPPELRPVLVAPLGDLTGSLEADTSGITGQLKLTFDK